MKLNDASVDMRRPRAVREHEEVRAPMFKTTPRVQNAHVTVGETPLEPQNSLLPWPTVCHEHVRATQVHETVVAARFRMAPGPQTGVCSDSCEAMKRVSIEAAY